MQPLSAAFETTALLETVLRNTLAPGLFFVKRDYQMTVHSPREETITWEIFRGQLLDGRHTRSQQAFTSVHVGIKSPGCELEDPLLTIRMAPPTCNGDAHNTPDPTASRPACPTMYVTRWLRCHVWEAFDEDGVIGSREVACWIEELVGTVAVSDFSDLISLMRELRVLVFHALVGLSRLPLNSVEAPLPAFSLGTVGFLPGFPEGANCVTNCIELFDRPLARASALEESKLLELFLRTASPPDLVAGAHAYVRRVGRLEQSDPAIGVNLRRMFNEASLTPNTDFVEKALTFANLLCKQDAFSLESYSGFLAGLIRQTVYHLTAYDLIAFHHQGANYPDALLLAGLLRDILILATAHPGLFSLGPQGDRQGIARTRRRRRALLLGWWMYRFLEGLPVPDEPTSPGENVRVLPPPHRRVPDEQLQQRGRRTRRLFAEQPVDWQVHHRLVESILDELADPEMLQELGTALYLDRPFGATKLPVELDLTPLLSYELFSCAVVRERLSRIQRLEPWLDSNLAFSAAQKQLEALQVLGIRVPPPFGTSPTVRLQDCWRVADDFVIRRPTPETVRQLRAYFNWEECPTPLREWHERGLLPIPMPGSNPKEAARIIFYETDLNPQIECAVASEQGFMRRGALELPMPGMRTTQAGITSVISSRFPSVPIHKT